MAAAVSTHAMGLDWNAARFEQGGRGAHVESYFLKLNDPDEKRALWLKATILDKVGFEPVGEAWAVSFERGHPAVAAKNVVPFAEARFDSRHLDVRVKDLELEAGRTRGRIDHEGHSIEWDLTFSTDADPLVPFPYAAMYRGPVPSSKLVTPHPDSRFDGHYSVDGDRVEVSGWRGMQGHNWGRGHAESYAWSHCNQWHETDELVVEGLTARVRMGPVLVPPLTLVCVRYRGVRYDLNEPKVLLRAEGEVTPRSWRFRATGPHARVEGEVFAATDDFGGLYYENPDGAMTYCLNSKIAEARLELELGGRAPMTVTSRSAALEIGTRKPGHGVRMLV